MMKRALLALLSIAAFSALASAATASTAAHRSANGARAAAVFVATNESAGNRVVVYGRAADGTLTPNGNYATGGKGAVEIGAVVDSLACQGSLVCDAEQHLLFAVNAGSDSLSVFGVEGGKLALRQVVDSGGSFPSSVTVNATSSTC